MIGKKLGPYEILESIGSGGMGEVWKARDTRLGRIVAIKKVKEQHSERFKQEARSIAALNHPNICQIFDIGDDYLVLEYIEGKPLSSPLPEQEAVRLAIQIAAALEEAHQHGIIHRDLKPSNIMVTEKGSVKLLDFGLAKLYEQDVSISSLPTADFPATQAGAILGTVAYMSPEQAQGKPADARSDIFSFGLVLYEMLSGKRAFSGDSNFAVMEAIVRKEPPSLQTSPALEQIIKRCLEKNPSKRYQSMSEAKTALEKTIKEKAPEASAEPQPSIAVLPFADMSPGKDNEWFSDGLAEEIINALTKVPGLLVIARTSAFAFKDKQEDIRRIAEVLGVANILEGSVRKSGNRIRVTAQLIEANKGGHLWSERFDRDLTDVFAIQDEIAEAITDALKVKLSVAPSARRQYEPNLAAHEAYLKARYHLQSLRPDSLTLCKEYFEQAIAMDQHYASPWHGLAAYYHVLGTLGSMLPKIANAQSKQAILKALELDNMLPAAHAHLASLLAIEFDWKGAEKEFHLAFKLSSNSSDVWHLYGIYYLMPMRRIEEAHAAMQRAHELDPLAPNLKAYLGFSYILMKQYDQAIAQCRSVLELDPYSHLANLCLGSAYLWSGKLDEGVQAIEEATNLLGHPMNAYLAWAYAMAGRTSEARSLLDELRLAAQKIYIPAWAFATIYSGLDEIDECFNWTFKAIENQEFFISMLINDPGFDPLRSHPRYKALLRKMNLEP